MFRRDKWFIVGWVYFVLMFVLEATLPEWTGEENGVIETLQFIWLFGGFYYCFKMRNHPLADWGGDQTSLWYAGMIYFFLLTMREISWGRNFFRTPEGKFFEYSDMGLWGQMVHPMVGIFIILGLVFLYRARVWRMVYLAKIPVKSTILLFLFIIMARVGEKRNFMAFYGEVAEELSEFGGYMMMYFLMQDMVRILQKLKDLRDRRRLR